MLSRAMHLAKSLARNISEILHFVQDDNISANEKPRSTIVLLLDYNYKDNGIFL